MMELYSNKVCEIAMSGMEVELDSALSHLNAKEKEFLVFLLTKRMFEFAPKTPLDKAYKQCGNSVVVPVIRRIAENIKITYKEGVESLANIT